MPEPKLVKEIIYHEGYYQKFSILKADINTYLNVVEYIEKEFDNSERFKWKDRYNENNKGYIRFYPLSNVDKNFLRNKFKNIIFQTENVFIDI